MIDGDASAVLDDVLEMEIDLLFFLDIKTTGIDVIKDKIKNRICIKSTVDMKDTLGLGKPLDVKKEGQELVRSFHTKRGGFICEVLRWNRPEYPEENVLASVEAFNEYRI